MDIEFKNKIQKFKYRVNGIVIHNNKILTIKMKNNISYCLPGGHVELGEDTNTAILREMLEELDTNVSIDKEIAIVENFYIDKKGFQTHELSFYYMVTPENFNKITQQNFQRLENDKGKTKVHNFEWLDLNNLDTFDLKPLFIKNKLINNNYNLEHFIIK